MSLWVWLFPKWDASPETMAGWKKLAAIRAVTDVKRNGCLVSLCARLFDLLCWRTAITLLPRSSCRFHLQLESLVAPWSQALGFFGSIEMISLCKARNPISKGWIWIICEYYIYILYIYILFIYIYMDECFFRSRKGLWPMAQACPSGRQTHQHNRYAKQQIEATRTSCILNRCTRQI